MTQTPLFDNPTALANFLRLHRRRTGLSQEGLGRLLGYDDESAVAKHERFQAMPPFLVALGYEIIFQVPVSQLFPGVMETVALGIEARLDELERSLRQSGETARLTAAAKRTLDWLEARRGSVAESQSRA
jgi:transcriptional regulator with XRE-family HTH domain